MTNANSVQPTTKYTVGSDGSVVGPVDLGPGTAFEVNDSGLVVGRDTIGPSGYQAVYWQLMWDGSALTVDGPYDALDITDVDSSAATGVNQAGYICGEEQRIIPAPGEALIVPHNSS